MWWLVNQDGLSEHNLCSLSVPYTSKAIAADHDVADGVQFCALCVQAFSLSISIHVTFKV